MSKNQKRNLSDILISFFVILVSIYFIIAVVNSIIDGPGVSEVITFITAPIAIFIGVYKGTGKR